MTEEKQVALISGASRGIGRAILTRLGMSNCIVVGTSTSSHGAQAITDYINEKGMQGCGLVLDVTSPESIKACIDQVAKAFGPPLILINNAGITDDNLFVRMKSAQWTDVIQTNLSSIFHMTQQCLKPMIKKRWGRVVSIGSVVGSAGNPGQVNYCAAKAGLIGATKSMALEYAQRGVTFNVVSPGFIRTDMTDQLSDDQQQQIMNQIPMQRMGTAEDISNCVAFLVSHEANYITGQTFHVKGGMLMN